MDGLKNYFMVAQLANLINFMVAKSAIMVAKVGLEK